jgi:hypothetical protein
MIIVVIFITTSNKKILHLSNYHSQFYCIWVLTKLFIDPNDTIINKNYLAWRRDASGTITANFCGTVHGYLQDDDIGELSLF